MRRTSDRRLARVNGNGRAYTAAPRDKGSYATAAQDPLRPDQLRCPHCGRGVTILEPSDKAFNPATGESEPRPYPVLRGHCGRKTGPGRGPGVNCPGSQMALACGVTR